ncbi:hypothetical protein [Pontibacter sp. SGAir0037]|uniref:hypothetical protein n=1 Tax=Pontibacter sp. SGAir0037 TaxID=2571030 RepID=UPI0010F737A1|nr:hypothetical protein [Pontibacter sp. SGAir0037]
MKLTVTFLLFLSLFTFSSSYAQEQVEEEERRPVGSVYIGAVYMQPVGAFRSTYPNGDAIGGTFGLLVNPLKRATALEVGAQVSYLSQGIHKVETNNTAYHDVLKTAHSIIPIHLVARLKSQTTSLVKPYLDGLAGISIFNTRTKIKEDLLDFMQDGHQPVILNKHNSTGISYGLGAGLLFHTGKSKETMADIRLVYLYSPIEKYVQRGHVTVLQDGFPAYSFSLSETSMFMLQLNLVGILTN